MYSLIGVGALVLSVLVASHWFRAVNRVALPRNRGGHLLILALAAMFGLLAITQGANWTGAICGGISIVIGVFFIFTVAIGAQKASDQAIAAGAQLPVFGATDENNESFDSIELAGTPVLIKFFRGHW